VTTWRHAAAVVSAAILAGALDGSCRRRPAAPPPSNNLLIIGYDREPDTLNRFSTHILEDIQTCVVEGLTTTDEAMKVVPLLAVEVPTLQNGGVPSSDPRVRKGLDWLRHHQNPTGHWVATSPNKLRDPGSEPAKFMSDAATALAVLSLTHPNGK